MPFKLNDNGEVIAATPREVPEPNYILKEAHLTDLVIHGRRNQTTTIVLYFMGGRDDKTKVFEAIDFKTFKIVQTGTLAEAFAAFEELKESYQRNA